VEVLCGFATRLTCDRIAVLLRDQKLAKHMKITAQHAEVKVTVETALRAVAATHQPIAGLQGTNRRFHARMALACLMEFDRGFFVFLGSLTRAGHRKTGAANDPSEFLLVLRRVETPVERRAANAAAQATLQLSCLLDDHILVVGACAASGRHG